MLRRLLARLLCGFLIVDVVAGWLLWSWPGDLLARFVLGCSAFYAYVVVVPSYIG
jgi:hypothetical protein